MTERLSIVILTFVLVSTVNAFAFKLPDTGQTLCYDPLWSLNVIDCYGTGQDGEYNINPMSFTIIGTNSDMVQDNNTGLIWQRADDGITRTWYEASSYCDSSSLGGYFDWRLPSIRELASILNYGSADPAIDSLFFPDTKYQYWSSTDLATFSDWAWTVFFRFGDTVEDNKTDANYVYTRCVRGATYPLPRYSANGKDTISDITTTLEWQREENITMTRDEAIQYCENLMFADSKDWRLPNARELQFLVDYSRHNQTIDTSFFLDAHASYYWTSTTPVGALDWTWATYFDFGATLRIWMWDNYYGRCVRGGQCNYPTSCAFPDFAQVGVYIGGEYVYKMDVFNGVPSYLNSKSNGQPDSSYYQCTEYAARYLNHMFGTDYTTIKDVAPDADTQGFNPTATPRGRLDFHPNYAKLPPTVEINNVPMPLYEVTLPKAGDIVIIPSPGHTAVVKAVSDDGTSVTLIEQNWTNGSTFKVNRTISASPGLGAYFYRFPAAVIEGTNSYYSTIQDAYADATTNGQLVLTQALIFTEDPVLNKDVSVTLQGGYDYNFQSDGGWTVINGQLTISAGTVTLDRVCIQ